MGQFESFSSKRWSSEGASPVIANLFRLQVSQFDFVGRKVACLSSRLSLPSQIVPWHLTHWNSLISLYFLIDVF